MEERLARRDLHCPVCRAEVEPSFLVCPVCTTKLKQACASCSAPLEALWQVCPYCETPVDAPTVDPAARHVGRASSRARAGARPPKPRGRARRVNSRAPMAVEQHPDPVKPDAVAAQARRRDPRALRAPRLRAPRRAARCASTASSREDALRRARARSRSSASSSTSSPRRRRSRSCSRARARSRRARRRSARRTRPTPTPGLAPRRPRARDAGQPRARLRLARVGGARDRAVVPRRACLTPDTSRNRELWTRDERGVHRRARARGVGARGDHWGIWRDPRVASSASSATSTAWTSSSSAAGPRTSRPGSRGAARGRSASTRRRRSSRRRGAMQARVGLEFPLVEASAEDVPLPGRVVRPRRLRVRRVDLGRPVPLDPRGGAAAAAGRAARLPAQLDARRSSARRDDGPGDEQLAAAAVRACTGSSGPDGRRRVPPRARRLDRAAARERLRGRGLVELQAPPDARDARVLRLRHAPSGRGSGRPRRSGGAQARA